MTGERPVLVLGGYGGFGRRIAGRLADAGHRVIVAGRDLRAAERACDRHAGMIAMRLDRDRDLAAALVRVGLWENGKDIGVRGDRQAARAFPPDRGLGGFLARPERQLNELRLGGGQLVALEPDVEGSFVSNAEERERVRPPLPRDDRVAGRTID